MTLSLTLDVIAKTFGTAQFTFNNRMSHFFLSLCTTITLQPIELERCSNPLSSSSDFKKIQGFGFFFCVL